MPAHDFDAVLLKDPDSPNAWSYITVPFSVFDAYGERGPLRVTGTVDGVPYDATLSPYGGHHTMVVRRATLDVIGKGPGDTIHVVIEPDTAPRVLTVPDDFAEALAEHDIAGPAWEKLAYSHRKEYVDWIADAKKRDTRERRIAKALDMIAEGQVRKR